MCSQSPREQQAHGLRVCVRARCNSLSPRAVRCGPHIRVSALCPLRPPLLSAAPRNTPAYLHNPHILSGYRVHFSRRLALHSLFRLHNETLNIWTHLLPAIYFTWRFVWSIAVELPSIQLGGSDPNSGAEAQSQSAIASDFASFGLFYASACACFYLSALYHLMGCCSYDTHACLYRCDVSGILSLIGGSYIPALHYAFRCRPHLQWAYSATIGALVALLLVLFNVPACNTRRLHSVRVGALVLSVAFAVLPTLHWLLGVLPHDYPDLPQRTFLLPLVAMLACYLLGFGFYSRHVPEKWAPGRFDFALQSHNWWHLLVATAALIWEYELWTMLENQNKAVC